MNGQRARLGQVLGKAATRTLASWDPISASPAAGLETSAALDAFGPSLMPRCSLHQGVAAGLAVLGLAYLPERSGEPLGLCVARSGGILIGVGAISGAIYDLAVSGRGRRSGPGTSRLLLTSLTGLAGVTLIARERLHGREEVIQKWTEPDKPAELAGSALVAQGVTMAGARLARPSRGPATPRSGSLAMIRRTRSSPERPTLRAGQRPASLLYHAGISYIGRDNEKIEPAYAEPPVSPLRSGSPHSKAPFSELGREGRRYVTDAVTPDLLLVSPTGTGWVDQTMISSAEPLTRGDIATCAIQYGRFPSFLCWQKVPAGRQQFRALLWGVKERLASLPAERRPKVLVFGESLGAWASSDICMRNGVAGLDSYGDARASLSPRLLVARPDWLRAGRGRGVPASVGWIPLITFVQTAVDAMNAMRTVPGVFESFGHDYRGDTARFVHTAFGLPPVAGEQMQAVEQVLRKLELDRGRRIKATQRAAGQDRPLSGRRTAGARRRRSFQPNYLQLSRPARRATR